MSAEPAPTITRDAFRHAMSRLGAAVNLITTDGAAGRHGLTASAVCSVTDSPPTLLVCINRGTGTHQIYRDNGVLCVNVLAPRHEPLSGLFAGRSDIAERFASGHWGTLTTGAPVLLDAGVSFDCRISQVQDVGTHGVFFCEIVDLRIADDAQGLVYFDRGYHPLGLSLPG